MLRIPGQPGLADPATIIRLQGAGNYTIVHLLSAPKPIMVTETLKYFEERLPDFIRVNKSELINPVYVSRLNYIDGKRMHVELKNGLNLSVSRRRMLTIRQQLTVK